MPALTIVSADPVTGSVGRRPSGAPFYRRGSRFGPPDRRKLDRNVVARILFAAEALDRRTRAKGQHGGILKAKGLDVLRALLRRFYSHRDGTCYPSYDAIAEAAGCCRTTVRRALRALEAAGIVDTIRRKVVATFTRGRDRFDCAVQDSNSYLFNFALPDRAEHGDLALSLLQKAPEGKFRPETSERNKNTMPADLAAALERLGRIIEGSAGAR